jgi:acyl carrier protein
LGQSDYCAANAFLDALAHQNARRQPGVVTSINWDMWQQVGMSVPTDEPVPNIVQQWREEQLGLALQPAEGIQAFDRLVACPWPQVAVCTIDLDARVERFRLLTSSRILQQVEPFPKLTYPRPSLHTPYQPPRNETEQLIASIWQDVLGIERVGVHDNFFELGGDSLIGLRLLAQLNRDLGVEIPAFDLYNGPTISTLTDLITQMNGQPPDDDAEHPPPA